MISERKRVAAKWLAWVMVFLFVFGGVVRTFAMSSSSISAKATWVSCQAKSSDSKKSNDKKKGNDKNKDSDKGSQGKGYGG